MLTDHIKWSRELFERIAEGGVWGIPRSGLVFNRRGNVLVLVARMPHVPQMPISVEQLDEQQKREFADVKRHFEAAGIKVEWKVEDHD
jgi:hypothetical protein